jgi:hypothetical protein
VKNVLHVMGWMGCKKAYLNIPLEEAKARFLADNEGYDFDANPPKSIEFDDEFECYDI